MDVTFVNRHLEEVFSCVANGTLKCVSGCLSGFHPTVMLCNLKNRKKVFYLLTFLQVVESGTNISVRFKKWPLISFIFKKKKSRWGYLHTTTSASAL